MRLYMIVSNDEYELPLAVSDSIADIARTMRMNILTLRTGFCKGRNPQCKEYRYYRKYVTVDVEDE